MTADNIDREFALKDIAAEYSCATTGSWYALVALGKAIDRYDKGAAYAERVIEIITVYPKMYLSVLWDGIAACMLDKIAKDKINALISDMGIGGVVSIADLLHIAHLYLEDLLTEKEALRILGRVSHGKEE